MILADVVSWLPKRESARASERARARARERARGRERERERERRGEKGTLMGVCYRTGTVREGTVSPSWVTPNVRYKCQWGSNSIHFTSHVLF